LAMSSNEETSGQQTLSFVEVGAAADVYEYSVLATSLDEELVSFGQLYRVRESLPSFPSGPSVAFAPTPRAQLTHNRWSKKPSNQPTIQRQLPFLGSSIRVAITPSRSRAIKARCTPMSPCSSTIR